MSPERKKSKPAPAGVKQFVLDTNVLVYNPDAMFVFQENHVVIPFPVIEELDKLKKGEDEVARNARQAIRHLDRLRAHGNLTEGVRWGDLPVRQGVPANGNSGTIRVVVEQLTRPDALKVDNADNEIITVAWHLKKEGKHAIFVSNDLAARIKSDALGITTEDFQNQKVDAERLYQGYVQLDTPGELIDELYKERMLPIERLSDLLTIETESGDVIERHLAPNEFLILRDIEDDAHSGLARRLSDTDQTIPVHGPRKPISGIMARNVQQTMALDLLLDDEIRLVTLLGSAGTGKTLLAIAAGLTKVFQEERYDKLLVARPIMPMGRDIGYLPGTKDEKLEAWMQPIFDNLSYLLSTRGSQGQAAESHTTEQRIEKLIADGRLVLEPLTYIRGRSIPHQFMLVDEAQNLTPHEVKTIVSRVGEGTKIILTGDIQQIDHVYLDSSNNGLAYAVEKMKGLGIVGHITLAKSERSELASLAAERL